MNTVPKHKVVSNKMEFDAILQEGSRHLCSLNRLPYSGAGIVIENLDFAYDTNLKMRKRKQILLEKFVLKHLENFISSDGITRPLSFIQFKNCKFDDSYILFRKQAVDLIFSNCEFKNQIILPQTHYTVEFIKECTFKNGVEFKSTENIITFSDCIFKGEVNAEDVIFENKVRFRTCHFQANANFRNTTFNDLADFWRCTFYKPTTFYKTDFMDIVVFSSANFKENVLFTYALIDKLMILRGTYAEKGFDISLAIINGDLNIFNFILDDFNTHHKIHKEVAIVEKEYSDDQAYIKAYQEVYEDAVSNRDLIPIENKRETYRILKNQLVSQKNFIDAVPYKVKESRTHFKESWQQIRHGIHLFNPLSNLCVLLLNGASNWFGLSYMQAALFTFLIGGSFFTLTLSHIGNFQFTWDYTLWQWEYFVQFLNPTHRFDYMKAIDENPRRWFFIWDFIGRIFVGYGIYQFIQAFRKYK